jgi:multidrug efflux pump subunit AcrA (membrane-fusion protein)
VREAESEVERARQELGPQGNDNPQFREALAAVERSKLDLIRTTVLAPSDGVITNLQLTEGEFVAVGQAALTYFLWDNPRDESSLINIECSLSVRGICKAEADSGFLSGGSSSLTVRAELQPLEWWNQPPTTPLPQSSQTQDVAIISSSGGVLWGVGREILGIETPSLIVSSQYDLQLCRRPWLRSRS